MIPSFLRPSFLLNVDFSQFSLYFFGQPLQFLFLCPSLKSQYFQGSVLGPGAAYFYTLSLCDLIHSCGVHVPVYIDDSLILASSQYLSPMLSAHIARYKYQIFLFGNFSGLQNKNASNQKNRTNFFFFCCVSYFSERHHHLPVA